MSITYFIFSKANYALCKDICSSNIQYTGNTVQVFIRGATSPQMFQESYKFSLSKWLDLQHVLPNGFGTTV